MKPTFFKACVLAAIAGLVVTSQVHAQEAKQTEKANEKPMFNWALLLQNSEASKDLEMVTKQIEKAKKMLESEQDDYYRELKKITSSKESSDEQDGRTMVQKMKDHRNQYRKRIKEKMDQLLLPHQVERLNQLAGWAAINQVEGYAEVLISDKLAPALKIDATQTKTIQQKSKQLQTDFEAELAELREKFRNKLTKELTAKQRSKLKELTGDKADIDSPSIRF